MEHVFNLINKFKFDFFFFAVVITFSLGFVIQAEINR